MKNYLITIIGPTAIGKTALSIKLAQHFNCDIVSCDSRQFFKEIKIGTAVPNLDELKAAKHHFIQNKSIHKNYNVGEFERDAALKLEELFKENNIQIMVGGSGLYVDAVLNGFDTFPEIDTSIKKEIKNNYSINGIIFLQKKLKELDPYFFDSISIKNPQTLQNPQRMMRFVEVCIGSNKPYSSFLNKDKNTKNFIPILIGLQAERQVMYDRINLRVDNMIFEGLLDEVKSIYPYKELNALQTVGYRELFDYLDGKTTLDFAIEEIKKNTRRFAKRQLTWFKRLENTLWFDYLEPSDLIIKAIKDKIKNI